MLPILAGLTTNTLTKAVAAAAAGGKRFAQETVPGLVLVILAACRGEVTHRRSNLPVFSVRTMR
ncbi:MAG: hypothetical protein ACM3SU_10950 [Acidobacteriota bacterium]